MATNFSPCKGSYVLNQFPSNVMFGMNGFHISASGAIQGHHGPLVMFSNPPKFHFINHDCFVVCKCFQFLTILNKESFVLIALTNKA